jgi:hypothetical protein
MTNMNISSNVITNQGIILHYLDEITKLRWWLLDDGTLMLYGLH